MFAGNGGSGGATSGNGGGGGDGSGRRYLRPPRRQPRHHRRRCPSGNTVTLGMEEPARQWRQWLRQRRRHLSRHVNLYYNTNAGVTSLIGNDIEGTTEIIKGGTGTLSLAGNSAYTGPTLVTAGTLNVTGSITSFVTIQRPGHPDGLRASRSNGRGGNDCSGATRPIRSPP